MKSNDGKRVGLFCEVYPPIMDGVSLTVQNYARELQALGQDVLVATAKAKEPLVGERAYELKRCFSLPLYKRPPYRYPLPYLDPAFSWALKKTDFSLIHAHAPFNLGKLGLRIAKKRDIPIVATFHSKYRSDIERVIKDEKVVDFFVRDIIRYFELVDEVWIPQASAEEYVRSCGYKGELFVMHNGTDFWVGSDDVSAIKSEARLRLRITEAEEKKGKDIPVLLFVGQHTWEKNTKLLIEALEKIKDLEFSMYFVGTGYAEDGMKALVKKFGLSDKVHFEGAIYDRELLKQYYAAADLFLFPSLYDTAGIVVREAAALHVPTLVVEGSAATEIIFDGKNGYVAKQSADDFAIRLRQILADRDAIIEVGDQAALSFTGSWSSHLLQRRFSTVTNGLLVVIISASFSLYCRCIHISYSYILASRSDILVFP